MIKNALSPFAFSILSSVQSSKWKSAGLSFLPFHSSLSFHRCFHCHALLIYYLALRLRSSIADIRWIQFYSFSETHSSIALPHTRNQPNKEKRREIKLLEISVIFFCSSSCSQRQNSWAYSNRKRQDGKLCSLACFQSCRTKKWAHKRRIQKYGSALAPCILFLCLASLLWFSC